MSVDQRQLVFPPLHATAAGRNRSSGCIPHSASPLVIGFSPKGFCRVARGCRAATTPGKGAPPQVPSTLKGLRHAGSRLQNPVGVSAHFDPFYRWVAAARQPRAVLLKPFGLPPKQYKVRNAPRSSCGPRTRLEIRAGRRYKLLMPSDHAAVDSRSTPFPSR
jgi:hypothetical protein